MRHSITTYNWFQVDFHFGQGEFLLSFIEKQRQSNDKDDDHKTIRRIISKELGIAKSNIRNIVWEWHHDYDLGDDICEFTFNVVGLKK